MKNNENKKIISISIIFIVIIGLVFLLPYIYDFVEKLNMPKVEQEKQQETVEQKEVDEETLDSIHRPLMRNSVYDINTYYSLNSFDISSMSNNDILYNAFLDIYEGNLTPFEGIGNCTTISKQLKKDYIELRIKNILGKNVNYTLSDFYVPEDAQSNYVGSWSYDGVNNRFIYNGLCTSNVTNTRYYNLEELVSAEYQDRDIIVYYYVGFAKVEGNNYIIYSDPNMKNEINSGVIYTVEELNTIFESLNKDSKKLYRYTFKNTLCSYSEYCLYKGEWVNGI